jgi:uracil phosphoribosyltransferase
VGLYRDEKTLKPVQYYCKLPPEMTGRLAIVVDPMLATGNSSAAAIDLIKAAGPAEICLICLLAAPEGLATMAAAHPDVRIVTASVDSHLNARGYIVPGLGDAGDRIFGTQ